MVNNWSNIPKKKRKISFTSNDWTQIKTMKYGDRNPCKGLKQVQKCEGLISFVSIHTNSVRKCFLNYGSYNILSLSHSLSVADLIADT